MFTYKKLFWLSLIGFGMMWTIRVEAEDLYVPSGSYTTIQSAIDAATTGDTIIVSSGTYIEAIYINKSITLKGNGTPIITSQGLGKSTVTFDGTNTNNALISGFIITGAGWGGWWHLLPQLLLTNNIITENGTT